MADEHKNDLHTQPKRGDVSRGDRDEFDDAITTELTGVAPDGVDEQLDDADHSRVKLIGANLSGSSVTVTGDLLERGFVLNNRFEIVEIVHTGGMSSVYQALDRRRHLDGSDQIFVAIKVMRRSVAAEQESKLALEREAARIQRLSHPNIVNVFDFDEHDGRFYLVMEWLDGETVTSLLRRTRGQQLDRAFAWQIIEGTAAGVTHAHVNKVVHADINPSNIFITATHEIKLLDFGVAHSIGDDEVDDGNDRLHWATKTYASPDVLAGQAPVVEDDVFSLGCVAYRLLGGAHPFPGSTALDAREKGAEVALIPALPDREWQAIRQSLEYNRAERSQSADVFIRSTQGLSASKPGVSELVGRYWQWLLTLAILVAVVTSGFWWLGTPRTPVGAEQLEPATAATETQVRNLVALAEQAVADSRFIEPPGENARDYFRDLLAIDPANPVALSGLRAISDRYVRDAEASLRAGNPAASYQALAAAADTDGDNPAIEIVTYLLVAEGNQQLASAEAAAMAGDLESATVLLADARQYQHIEPAAIADVEARIEEQRDVAVLLTQLDIVEQRMADNQLIAPAGDSARDIVLALRAEYAGDERLQVMTNRLGEQLLTDAVLSTTAGEFVTAREQLNGVESLGILQTEIDAARNALEDAMASAEPEVRPLAEAATPNDSSPDLEATEATEATETVALETASAAAAEGPAESAPDAASTATETSPPRRQSLRELGIEKYVAPKFPRVAQRRELSGLVEIAFVVNPDGTTGDFEILQSIPARVFDDSAEKAVRQWRFAPRDEAVEARVTLSFEPAP